MRYEEMLIKSGKFSLSEKKTLLKRKVMLVDVTKMLIERPQKNSENWYFVKKKRHTIKTQVIVNQRISKILSVYHEKSSVHDFKLHKNTVGYAILGNILAQVSGYQGVLNFYKNSEISKKKSKKLPLTKKEKANNRRVFKQRVLIANIN
ncbi:MAG: hypothetical protein LBG80_20565 [Bacteroidales bacterium]|jgi:hypothetical protein|nr:hypothetical protein [Bacteroidales bacterium]